MTPGHQLSLTEIAGLLARHPIEAENIAQTKYLIEHGVYDWTQWIPGTIPPWGTQFEDSTWGTVTIFFGTDATLYVTGQSAPLADINKPAYVPPPHKCKNGSDAVLGICPEDFDFSGVILLAVAALVGYQMFFANK